MLTIGALLFFYNLFWCVLAEQGKNVQLHPYNGCFFSLSLFSLNMSGNWYWEKGVNHPSVNNNNDNEMSKRPPIANGKLSRGALAGTNRFSRGGRCLGYKAANSVSVVVETVIPMYRLSQHFVVHLGPSS